MSDEGFLDRWSRRKRTEAKDDAPQAAAPDRHEPSEPPETRSDEEILAALNLKHPDQLCDEDDLTPYVSARLPDHLRRLVLRRLWRSNPVLANLDGLCEYNEDYTDAATVFPDMKTAYEVGRGMVKRLLDDDAPLATAAPDPLPDAEGVRDPQPQDVATAAPPEPIPDPAPAPDHAPDPGPGPDPGPAPDPVMTAAKPRHMRLRFQPSGTSAAS